MNDPKRVLIADDNPAMAKVIEYNLSAAGYRTVVANNGKMAWDLLQDDHFDFLVTDYQMPEMDGRSLVGALRNSIKHRSLPVIMLTAKELELETAMASDELQLLSILQKPFSPSDLTSRIDRHFLSTCPA
jgi:DNA-binding response OmpR family regulator